MSQIFHVIRENFTKFNLQILRTNTNHNICHNILTTFVVSRCWDRLTTPHNNVVTTFILFLKCCEVVVAVWPCMVTTNVVTVWSGLNLSMKFIHPFNNNDLYFSSCLGLFLFLNTIEEREKIARPTHFFQKVKKVTLTSEISPVMTFWNTFQSDIGKLQNGGHGKIYNQGSLGIIYV